MSRVISAFATCLVVLATAWPGFALSDQQRLQIGAQQARVASEMFSNLAFVGGGQDFSYNGWTCYLVAYKGYEYRLCSAGADLSRLNVAHRAISRLVDQGVRIPMLAIYMHSGDGSLWHPDPDVRSGRKRSPRYWIQARGPRFEPVDNVFINAALPADPFETDEETYVLEALGSLLHERSAGDLYWEGLDDSDRDFVASEFAKFVLERAFGSPIRLSGTYADLRGYPLQ